MLSCAGSREVMESCLLHQSIRRRQAANGLAIIVANEGSCIRDHERLEGAIKDLYAMKETFETLRFATLPIFNASKEHILNAVKAVAKYKAYPPSYKRIAFVFSGHGDENCIYTDDGCINPLNEVVEPLQPTDAPHLGNIPKLFFIDACRGNETDKGRIVPRGGTIRVPSVGNYILAHSTMPRMVSYEATNEGGLWMQTVSRQLRTKRKSVLDVLTEVNTELMKELRRRGCETLQQPVLESALLETVSLLEEAEQIGKDLEVQLNFPPYGEGQEIFNGRQALSSLPMTANPWTSLHFTQAQHMQQPQQLSIYPVVVSGSRPLTHAVIPRPPPRQTMVGPYGAAVPTLMGSSVFPQSGSTDRFAQLLPMSQYQPLTVSPLPIGSQYTPQGVSDAHSNHPASSVWSSDVVTGSATANCESFMSEDAQIQLSHFCQTHSVNPQFSFIEDASSGQCRYKCTITYKMNGRPDRIDSPGYYTTKAEAKEKAVRILIAEETQVNAISSRGHSPTAKIWKSKLREYYDRSGQAGVQLKYITKECSKGGYQCNLFLPEIGYICGDICKSKTEAEHSAAYMALQKLKQV